MNNLFTAVRSPLQMRSACWGKEFVLGSEKYAHAQRRTCPTVQTGIQQVRGSRGGHSTNCFHGPECEVRGTKCSPHFAVVHAPARPPRPCGHEAHLLPPNHKTYRKEDLRDTFSAKAWRKTSLIAAASLANSADSNAPPALHSPSEAELLNHPRRRMLTIQRATNWTSLGTCAVFVRARGRPLSALPSGAFRLLSRPSNGSL